MKEYKLAVVGATGLVGRKVIEILEEYNLPISNIEFFASRRSAGTEFFFKGNQRIVKELKESSFDEGFDFAIFSAGSDISKKFPYSAEELECLEALKKMSYDEIDFSDIPPTSKEQLARMKENRRRRKELQKTA